MPRNELTHPSDPISGRTLMNLKAVLESYLGGGEVKDLDLALLMNVPLNRLSQLKRAKSSLFTVGRNLHSDDEPAGDVEKEDDGELPGIRPSPGNSCSFVAEFSGFGAYSSQALKQ